MWENLSEEEKNEYKRMILAFASLTEMFAQKADDENSNDPEILISPIINSKYQETVFQRVFHASAEDIGNTSYDASINHKNTDGSETKYLIGIKTFGKTSGVQKIAQFKANHDEWSELINKINTNSYYNKNNRLTQKEINQKNKDLYKELACNIALLRNMRLESSKANLHGFKLSKEKDVIQAVYHVLMPSKKAKKSETPYIYVGETAYDKIDIQNIQILGCTSSNNPSNFDFTDGKHKYRFTSADSQLLMFFNNDKIVKDKWVVQYAEDAYQIFSNIADNLFGKKEDKILESYSWSIEINNYSGFNAFYGVGSKLSRDKRQATIGKIINKYSNKLKSQEIETLSNNLEDYFLDDPKDKKGRDLKAEKRLLLIKYVKSLDNKDLLNEILRMVFRPINELYIPIPDSANFHNQHPDFFAPDAGKLIKQNSKWKLVKSKEERKFNLIFEPSGNSLKAFIAEDNGKAIESYGKQTELGKWILRKVFQLEEYEPLTEKRLLEVGINGIRLVKYQGKNDIHLFFIWINKDNPPKDYIKFKK